MKYKKVVIIGSGLIGGSVGKALLKKGLAEEVIGVCRRRCSADRAVKEKAVTSAVVGEYGKNCADADMVVIATPVNTIKDVLDDIAKNDLLPGTAITDAGSTKNDIVAYASRYANKINFVGSHPMAGSERSGVENSKADMFEGAVCIVTPDVQTLPAVKEKVSDLWVSLGASVHEMLPELHDRYIAFSSHLPHAVAYALAGVLEGSFPSYIFAGGFKDTTRIASSDAELWLEIFGSNRQNVLDAIGTYKEKLLIIEEYIRSGKKKELLDTLDKWRKLRDELV